MIPTIPAPEWVPHPRRDRVRAAELAAALGAPLPAAEVLVNRGVGATADARRFLEPWAGDLHDPFLLRDLDVAVERIERALAQGERIFLHGDYDVDGITSTFLLDSVLTELGGRVEVRIPDRMRDGYGLSPEAVQEAKRRGCGLVVTVDCGITAHAAVESALALGLDTIITDHHAPPAVLPAALALVNPLRPGCPYPFKALAGVGVTYKLAEALLRRRGQAEHARDYLDVVALGTIADVVPLVGENRVLARLGLERLNGTERIGLQALKQVSGLSGSSISSGQVAFVLAPRINAAGRMGNAEQGYRLLRARDRGEALALAESLEEDNQRRRRFDEEALEQARRCVEAEFRDSSSILLWSEQWHQGVIGIVASRLVERFHRPAVLVSLREGRGRGSGRSVEGVDLSEVLGQCSDLLVAHGGHALAAGLTVRQERLAELRERFERLVRERRPGGPRTPPIEYDAEVALSECDRPLTGWLERMAPHGLGNREPLFRADGLAVVSARTVGAEERHLRLQVRDGSGAAAEAIAFGKGELCAAMRRGVPCSLLFTPTRNTWREETRVQLKVKDIRLP